jgi:hypothetical protein
MESNHIIIKPFEDFNKARQVRILLFLFVVVRVRVWFVIVLLVVFRVRFWFVIVEHLRCDVTRYLQHPTKCGESLGMAQDVQEQ